MYILLNFIYVSHLENKEIKFEKIVIFMKVPKIYHICNTEANKYIDFFTCSKYLNLDEI